jgi:hypothetical protein
VKYPVFHIYFREENAINGKLMIQDHNYPYAVPPVSSALYQLLDIRQPGKPGSLSSGSDAMIGLDITTTAQVNRSLAPVYSVIKIVSL